MSPRVSSAIPYLICLLFFVCYSTLSVVRHFHFGSYGFDLGIADQIVWKYSRFKAPITTIQFYPFTSLLTDHVEIIYAIISPLYWLFPAATTLLVSQAFLSCISGLPVYFLAKKKGIRTDLALAIVVAYLSFYGIQNALWFDVHSLVLGASFLPWFLWFLEIENYHLALVSLILGILSREDVALLTAIMSLVFYLVTQKKAALYFLFVSIMYLIGIFAIYFPYFTHDGYRYANPKGLFYDLQPNQLYDNKDKLEVYFYSLGWYGFIPIFAPIYLLPAIGDIFRFFVIGKNIVSAQGLFMHYRVTLAFLMGWPFIEAIKKYQKLNSRYMTIYVLVVITVLQYSLHVPLTYLTKKWFWTQPKSSASLQFVLGKIPRNASVVAQNNILPHTDHRDKIFTLWPSTRNSQGHSLCNTDTCNWFRWSGNPQFLIVDTSAEWDIRHLLANHNEFNEGLKNLEKNSYIKKKLQSGSVILYAIIKQPSK